MSHELFMRRVFELAHQSIADNKGTPYSAIIVKDNVIIAEGVNMSLHDHDPTAHGEVVALRRAGAALNSINLSGCDLYTTCEPCPMCAAAIWWSKIRTVYYAVTAEDCRTELDLTPLETHLNTPIAKRTDAAQLFKTEGAALFQQWYAKPWYRTMWD